MQERGSRIQAAGGSFFCDMKHALAGASASLFVVISPISSSVAALPASIAGGAPIIGNHFRSLPVELAAGRQSGFSVVDILNVSGQPVPLTISVPRDLMAEIDKAPGPVFLMFSGLPKELSLSAGFRIRDSWAVSLKEVQGLQVLSPVGFERSSILHVILRRGGDVPPLETSFVVTLASRPLNTMPTASAPDSTAYAFREDEGHSQPPLQIDIAPPPVTKKMVVPNEELFLSRADDLLKSGDFQSARQVFEDLADRGSATAAVRMAQSFEIETIQRFRAIGLNPEPQKARAWYQRAVELGSDEAVSVLRRLAKQ